jgi:hypothetical protein
VDVAAPLHPRKKQEHGPKKREEARKKEFAKKIVQRVYTRESLCIIRGEIVTVVAFRDHSSVEEASICPA